MSKIKHNLSEEYLQSLTEEERIRQMSEWTPSEWEEYFCPNGTMTLDEFIDCIKSRALQMIKEKYGDPEELMEYAWLKPKFSGLNVDIFIDDSGAYLRHEHPLRMYFRNGYSRSDNVFLPISVDGDNPQVLLAQYDLSISTEDFDSIVRFVKANAERLVAFANRELSHVDFFRIVQ